MQWKRRTPSTAGSVLAGSATAPLRTALSTIINVQALRNGKALETLLCGLGPELLRQYRQQRDISH